LGIREIKKRNYVGKVYDIQTNGSFCVPFAVHNCWIFPKGKNEANVGIGITGAETKTAKAYLDEFIAASPSLSKGSIIDVNAGGIPVGGFLENMTADNLLVCGDAAHQVNPIHGGGIGIAIEGARIAADVASDALKKGDVSEKFLSAYNKRWYSKRGNQLKDVLKRRHMLEKLSDNDFETIADALDGDDVLKIAEGDLATSAKIITKKLIKKPALMKVMLKYLR
jgi:digeranylgeranylglycerophospholipid reductase